MTSARVFPACAGILAIGLFAEIAASAPITYEREEVADLKDVTRSSSVLESARWSEPSRSSNSSMFATADGGRYQTTWHGADRDQAKASAQYAYAFIRDDRSGATRLYNMVNGRVDAYDVAPVTRIGVIPTAIPILALGLALFGLLARRRGDEVVVAETPDEAAVKQQQ
jgi:hypothetical protein